MIANKGHFTVDSSRVITVLKVTPGGVYDAKVVEALAEAQPLRPREFCAEAKTLHGLRRALFRGLEKTSIQALLTASVQNIKRLIKHCRDRNRIGQTAVNTYIKEGPKNSLESFDSFLTLFVRLKCALFLKG